MLLKEAAERLGKTDRAVYRHIERGTPLGKVFKKKYGRWICSSNELRRFVK